jgi:PAS domain S-box-containing protein
LLIVLAACVSLLFPKLSSEFPLLPFFLAVIASAWFGGFRAGALASIISILAVRYYFSRSSGFYSMNEAGLMRLLIIGAILVAICWLIDHDTKTRRLVTFHREQAETQLRRHQAIVSSAARIAGMGSWEYDLVNDRLVWDDETFRIFGITREEFGGNLAAFFSRVHPEDREALNKMERQALANHGTTEMEYRIVRPDGEIRRVYDRGQVTLSEDGKPVQSTGMIMDITERRQAMEDLRESKERYEAAIGGSDVGIWDWNILTGRLFFSPRYKELLGYKDEEFPNEPASFIDALNPEDRPRLERAFMEHVKKHVPFNAEYRLRTKSGEYRWFNARGQALWNAEDRAYRMAGSLVDITERLLMEERFHQSQRIEAVGRLAGGVAHDFNNMLGVILGHCVSLEEKLPVGIPEWQSIRQIKQAATRSANLTRQLLAFSRKQILLPKVLDLNATVAELSSMLKSLIGDDIELVIKTGHNTGLVKADPGQIGQVVINLVVNARDAMPQGGRILIETRTIEVQDQPMPENLPIPQGTYVTMSISDTGCGIDPQTLQHIFEPFFTTKEEGQGTGLGLATVYGIVKQSEGFILAESQVGKGTTFHTYLPQVQGAPEAASTQPEESIAAGGDETILIAEDEPMLREIVRVQLETAGYTVLEARDGKEAMATAELHKGKIDLLLTDVVMAGGTNGLDLATKLHSVQPDLKVIYMTGYTADLIDQKGMSDLQERLLQKPFTAASLRHKIREVLATS